MWLVSFRNRAYTQILSGLSSLSEPSLSAPAWDLFWFSSSFGRQLSTTPLPAGHGIPTVGLSLWEALTSQVEHPSTSHPVPPVLPSRSTSATVKVGAQSLAYKPHNTTYVVLGTVFLWFGWFGFNGGSALSANLRAAQACIVTNLAASVGGLTWMFWDYRLERKWSAVGFCSGAIAGLVAITPASGFVGSRE